MSIEPAERRYGQESHTKSRWLSKAEEFSGSPVDLGYIDFELRREKTSID
jgi:hypothetical protein